MGGYSQVKYQYNLLKAIEESGKEYLMVVNLSATDYPMVSNDVLVDELCKPNSEYIIGFCISEEEDNYLVNQSQKAKIEYFHMMDLPHILTVLINRLKIRRFDKIEDCGYKIYFGSEYWGISWNILMDLLHRFEADTKFQQLLKYAYVPSEMWIHTLFFNSEYAKEGIVYKGKYCGLLTLSPLEYFEYYDAIKVLTMDDYNKIKKSGKLFARKLIVGESDDLITFISREHNS